MWDIIWDTATCNLKLNCYTEYIKKQLRKNVPLQKFIFILNLYRCVCGGWGGGVLNKEMELCTQMTFSSLWDKAVEAILFLHAYST